MGDQEHQSKARGATLRARARRLWQRLLGREALWVLVFLATGLWVLLPSGSFFVARVESGQIATRDYLANRELLWEDEETTGARRARAREEVLTLFDFEPGVARAREDELVQLFEVGRATTLAEDDGDDVVDEEAETPLEALLAASSIKVDQAQLEVFNAHDFSGELEQRLKNVISEILQKGVVSNKSDLLQQRERGIRLRNLETGEERLQLDVYRYLDFPAEVQEQIETESRRWLDHDRGERKLLREFLFSNITPNVFLNRSESLARQEEAAQATPAVFQRRGPGQVIVRKGDQIDQVGMRFINQMMGRKSALSLLLPSAGQFLLLTLGAFLIWLALKREPHLSGEPRRILSGLLMLLTLSLVCLRFSILTSAALGGFFESAPFNSPSIYLYGIPYAAVALISFLLYGRSIALVTSIVFSVLSGQFTQGDSWTIVIYALVGSLSAIYFLDQVKKRSSVNGAGLVVGVVNSVSVMMIVTLRGGEDLVDLEEFGLSLVCGLVGGLLVAAVAGFAVPLFEWLLSLTTDVTLVELSNTNLPLLRRLAFEAPGTFQHSLMVANLAKAGCAEIGADAVLAYTSGLYHDIGKIPRSEYFIENQRGPNPHDSLEPSLSARIVISHVTDGLEMAGEARLPQVIIDAIAQHHGTNLLAYFHNRALESKGGETVDEDAYRYPGPKPQNRAMGVLMLADAVEAASRTLVEASSTSIRNVIDQIFDAGHSAGQLDETDLTLADLKALRAEFQRVLENLHHRRVDYPGFEFESDKESSQLRVVRGN